MENQDRQVIKDYKDLQVWQKSMRLAKGIYLLTQRFPVEERFGLVSQMRRAAVSIPSNIAEGQARNTTGEFIQYLSYAEGSSAELDTQLHLAIDLGYCSEDNPDDVFHMLTDVQKMLKRLRFKLISKH